MALLRLEIRIEDGVIKVFEDGSSSNPNHHSQACKEVVLWKGANNSDIESWVVQFVDPYGQPLPPDQSPFEGGKTRFEGTGPQPDLGITRDCPSCFEEEYKYTVECTVKNGPDPEPLDPILVIKDTSSFLGKAIAELVDLTEKVEHIGADLDDVSDRLRRLIGMMREAGE